MTVPGVYSPEQAALQAHVDKVIASDGVDDSRAVEVMARAAYIAINRHADSEPESWWNDDDWHDYNRPVRDWDDPDGYVWPEKDTFRTAARAALGALRALEGE